MAVALKSTHEPAIRSDLVVLSGPGASVDRSCEGLCPVRELERKGACTRHIEVTRPAPRHVFVSTARAPSGALVKGLVVETREQL